MCNKRWVGDDNNPVRCTVCTHTRPNSEIQYGEKPAQEIANVANSSQDFSADQIENSAITESVWTPLQPFLGKIQPQSCPAAYIFYVPERSFIYVTVSC